MAQLSQRYAGNRFHVDSVATNGNSATVRSTRTNPNGTSVWASVGTVVENNTWKVDHLG